MEATTLFIAIALLILFAVSSVRYGVDSRGLIDTIEQHPSRRGII